MKMSIRNKLLISFFITAALPAILIISLDTINYRNAMIREKLESLSAIAELKRKQIENLFVGIKRDVSVTARFSAVKRFFSFVNENPGITKGDEYENLREMAAETLNAIWKEYNVFDVMLIDKTGQVIYTSNVKYIPILMGKPAQGLIAESFNKSKSEIYISEVFRNPVENNNFTMFISAPTIDNGNFQGVVLFSIDLRPIYEIIQDNTGLGRTGETLIVKKIGNTVVWINTLRHHPQAALELKRAIGSREGQPAQKAVSGLTGVGFSIDYRGKEVLASWTPIREMNWGLVAKIDSNEALEIVNKRLLFSIIMTLLFIFVLFFLISMVAESFSRPVAKLVGVAQRVGRGDLSDTEIVETEDEIGKLSSVLHTMVRNLRSITVSRNELAEEILYRKKLEESLRQNQQMLAEAESLSRTGAWQWDVVNDTWFFSKEWRAIHGIKIEKLGSNELINLAHPDDRERIRDAFGELQTGPGFYEIEHRIIKQDTGKVRHIHARGRGIQNQDHNLLMVYGFSQDITERKQVEEELRQSEAFSRRILASSLSGLYIFDLKKQTIVYVSPQYNRLTGYTLDMLNEMGPEKFLKLFHPDDLQKVFKNIATAADLNDDQIREIEYRFKTADGRWRWFLSRETAFSRDSNGELEKYIGTFIDITERKQAEEELSRTHMLISSITTGTEDFIAAIDNNFNFLYLNDAFKKEFRQLWGKEINIGENMPETISTWPEEQKKARDLWSRALKGESFDSTMEIGPSHEQEQRRIYDLRFNPIYDQTGKQIGAAQIFRNVTERIRLQRAFLEGEQRLRWALQSAGGGAWDWNLAKDEIWWSAEMYQLWGIPGRPKITMEEALNIVHEEDRPALKKIIQRAISECGNFQHEFRIRHSKQGEKWMLSLGSIICDKGGTPVRMHGIIIDITQRKKAEEALMESESFYRQTLESIPGMVFTTRPDGYCDYQSKQWEIYTGTPVAEHLGDGWNQLLHPDDQPRALETWRAAVDGKAPYELEYRVRRYDGNYEWFRVIGKPIRDTGGKIVRWFGIALNVEKLKQSEESQRKSYEALELTNKELENFAYVASHDLQEPLRMITSYSQLLEKRLKEALDKDTSEFLKYIIDGTKRMQFLINDLLMYSRVGGKAKQFRWVDMNGVLKNVKDNLKITIAETNAIIRSGELPVIWSDETLMSQLLQNLIANAIKFHKPEMRPEVEIIFEETKEEWRFAVKDNGIGIDPKYWEKIFIIFSRLHTRDKYEGTGIGLSLCKKIVQVHGGKIWVKSNVGEGSVFYFTIPRRDKQ